MLSTPCNIPIGAAPASLHIISKGGILRIFAPERGKRRKNAYEALRREVSEKNANQSPPPFESKALFPRRKGGAESDVMCVASRGRGNINLNGNARTSTDAILQG